MFLLGDERAMRALEDLRQRADALACQNILYIVDVIDVMLLIRAGRLDEAEAAAGRCYELGTAVGEVDTLGYLGAHTLAIRWIQGRDSELLDMAEEIAASPTLVLDEFAFRATTAVIAARAGHTERARAALDHLTVDGLAALPSSSTWLVGMAAIVEVAAALADPAVAREAYDLLLSFADRPVMPSLVVVCFGSAERSLGMAAQAFDDPDRAVDHLERAVEVNRRLANRPLVAITQADLAETLRYRNGTDDQARAADLLRQAIAEADTIGMAARAAAWREDLSAAERSDVGRRHHGPSPRHGLLRQQRRTWLVLLDRHQVLVSDLVGMRYIAQLLSRPGQEIPALSLVGPVADERSRYELLDEQARTAYTTRARELSDDLAEAEANVDIGRAEKLRAELYALLDQIETATGLGGRPRTFTNPAERARTAVRKAIKRAIDQIDAGAPVIGEILRATITTGLICTYNPDPRDPVTWSIDLAQGSSSSPDTRY